MRVNLNDWNKMAEYIQEEYWPFTHVEPEHEFERIWGPETDDDLCEMFDRPVGERLDEAFALTEGEDIC